MAHWLKTTALDSPSQVLSFLSVPLPSPHHLRLPSVIVRRSISVTILSIIVIFLFHQISCNYATNDTALLLIFPMSS